MENSKGEYEPIVGFETREACMEAIKTAKREIDDEVYLTCFPTEFDPRIQVFRRDHNDPL
jgi:hypothetical protein